MPTLQARSPGRGTPSPPRPRGLGSLLPHPGLVPPEAPTVETKMGRGWGRGGAERRVLLLPWGWASSLWRARGRREKLQGRAFLKTGFVLIFIVFSVFP